MITNKKYIIDLHAPASPYLVVEFIKVIASSVCRDLIYPVITRPTGLAAQSGVPEAWRIAFKNNIPMIVLPEIRDVIEIYRPAEVLIIQRTNESKAIEEEPEILEKTPLLIVIPSGEQTLTKEEQTLGRKIHSKILAKDTNPLTVLGIILTKLIQ
ncbi:MAG: RecB-family nuclease [Sulfolobales archaeon]